MSTNGRSDSTTFSAPWEDNNDVFLPNFRAMCAQGSRYNRLVGHGIMMDSWGHYDVTDIPYSFDYYLSQYFTGADFNDPARLTNLGTFYRAVYNEASFSTGSVTNHVDIRNAFKGDIQTSVFTNGEQVNPNGGGASGAQANAWFMNQSTHWGMGRQCIKAMVSTQCAMIYAEGGPTSMRYNAQTLTNGVPMGPAKLLDLVFTAEQGGVGVDYVLYQNSTTGTTYDGRTINGSATAVCNTQIAAIKAAVTLGTFANAGLAVAGAVGNTDVKITGSINLAVTGAWNGSTFASGNVVTNQQCPGSHTGWINAAGSGDALNPLLPYVLVVFTRVNNRVPGIEGVMTGMDEIGAFASPYPTTGAHIAIPFSCPGAHFARTREYNRLLTQQTTHKNTASSSGVVIPIDTLRKLAGRKALANMSANFSHTCLSHIVTIGFQNDANSGELDYAGTILTGVLATHTQDLTDMANFCAAGYTDADGKNQPIFWTHIEIPVIKTGSYVDWLNGTGTYATRGTFKAWSACWDAAMAAVPTARKSSRRISLFKYFNQRTWDVTAEAASINYGDNHFNDAGARLIMRLIKDADSRACLAGNTR